MAQLSYPLDNTLYTAADAQIWHSTRTQGVYSSDKDLVLTPTTAMTVNLSPGVAWMKYNRFTNAVYANTTDLPFTIETAHGIFSRIDRLVIRWDNVTNTITAQLKKGTATTNPVAPILQRDPEAYELGIYDIRVKPGVLQITLADLTPLCFNEYLCGIMRDGVTSIPTQQLYEQWQSWYSNLTINAEKDVSNKLTEFERLVDEEFNSFNILVTDATQTIEFLTNQSQNVYNAFAYQLDQMLQNFNLTWGNWLDDKDQQLEEYPAGEWMAKVENLIAAQPSEKIVTIDYPSYEYPKANLWSIENGAINPLETWGFADGTLLTLPVKLCTMPDNFLEIYTAPQYKATDWRIEEYKPEFYLLSSLSINKALFLHLKE